MLAALVFVGYKYFTKSQSELLGGSDYAFDSATQATSSIGVYSWSTVLSADSSRGYTALCNNANSGFDNNNPVYLGFGATSTKPYGFRLASGACFEITSEKRFYGTIYAIASTATTTLLQVYK